MPDISDQAAPLITPDDDLLEFNNELLLDAETALLLAVRARLRRYLTVDVLPKDIHIELDEMAHPATGPVGIIITPDGTSPGNDHLGDGGYVHEVFGVAITVIMRSAHVPKDRWKHLLVNTDHYLAYNITLNQHVRRIRALIDFDYDTINHAADLLAANGDTRQGNFHPLVWKSQDRRPRTIAPEAFSASNHARMSAEGSTAIGKTVYFGDSARYTVRQNFTT